MDYHVEFLYSMQLLGKTERQFVENVQADKFWDRCKEDGTLAALTKHSTSKDKEYIGIADSSSYDGNSYLYYIATPYSRGNVPDGYTLINLPPLLWVKFKCADLGVESTASKGVWTKIYSEILPKSEYEPSGFQLEVYPCGDGSYPDEISEIWISVRKKPSDNE